MAGFRVRHVVLQVGIECVGFGQPLGPDRVEIVERRRLGILGQAQAHRRLATTGDLDPSPDRHLGTDAVRAHGTGVAMDDKVVDRVLERAVRGDPPKARQIALVLAEQALVAVLHIQVERAELVVFGPDDAVVSQ